jgi:hypothetical protein
MGIDYTFPGNSISPSNQTLVLGVIYYKHLQYTFFSYLLSYSHTHLSSVPFHMLERRLFLQ